MRVHAKTVWKQWKISMPAATFLLCLILGLCSSASLAGELTSSEYRVKAAFLYNFAKLVNWPTNTFATADSPLIIGVLGENPFGDTLESTVKGKKIDGRTLQVKHFKTPDELTDCHILFVCKSEKDHLPAILEKLRGKSVLLVGESDGFADSGGMIQLLKQDEAIRFEINTNATTRANLRVSSKLLQVARQLKSGIAKEVP